MTRPDSLAEAHDRLIAAVDTLTTSAEWLRFLDTARRFRTYSLNNVLLIFAQRPAATRVAGYRTWQSLGRQVRRGEQGIAILAPCTYRTTTDTTDTTGDATTAGVDATTTAQRVLRGFKVVHVFDLAQTDGEPLAEPPVHLLEGEDPDALGDRLADLIRGYGYTFTLGALPERHAGANGVTDFTTRAVTVRADLSPAQRAKTNAHELAHVLLHHPDSPDRPQREVCEIEAESVAYLVCGDAGLPTDAYSLGYVATWAHGDTTTIRATTERVTTCARHILDQLEPAALDDHAA